MAMAAPHPGGQAAEAAEEQGRARRPAVDGLPTEKPWEAAGRPGAYDPHARLADMDIDQVDAEVLYASATGGAELYGMDADACLAAFQAINDAAIEFASVDPSRLIPVYILPLHDIECALKEVQRIANEGARAMQLPLYPSESTSRPTGTTCTTRCGPRSRSSGSRSASTPAPTSTSSR